MNESVRPFEAYLHLRGAGGPTTAGPDQPIYFTTAITGTAQLWRIDEAMAWPEQVTFTDDRIESARHAPGRDLIAFTADSGGNERPGLYVMRGDGSERRELVPSGAPLTMGFWSPSARQLTFSHSHGNGRDFEAFVYDVETGETKRIWQDAGMCLVLDWLPGEETVIVQHYLSNLDSVLWRVDVATGERRPLSDRPCSHGSPRPTTHGKGVHLATDRDSDARRLGYIDFGTKELRFLDEGEETKWDVEFISASDDGRLLLVHRNVEGYTELSLFERDGAELRRVREFEPELGRGIGGGTRFIPGTHRVLLGWGAPDDTVDVWELELPSGRATRWTRSATGGLPRDGFRAPELIHYPSFDGLEIPAFYYRPRGGEAPYPVLIDIHGGPESQRRPTLSGVAQYFVDQGYAVLAPNVRGSRGYGREYLALDDRELRMNSVADIAAAHTWLVEHGEADRARIALMGGSYGGFMVLSSLVTYPDLWAAGIDFVGIANFVTFLENTSPFRRYLRESEFGSLEHDRALLEELSPIHRVDQIRVPLMVIHGRNDPRVPVSEAEQLAEAMRKKGQPVELLIYDDEGHGLSKRRNRLDAYPRVAAFLAEHLASGD